MGRSEQYFANIDTRRTKIIFAEGIS